MLLSFVLIDTETRLDNFLWAWSFPRLPFIALSSLAFIYLRGWRTASRLRPSELPPWRCVCFLSGLASLWLALASPIDALDDYLLAAHMIQHFMLMSVAPPLILLGAPTVPLLHGIPRSMIHRLLRPLFRLRLFHPFCAILTHPAVAWLAMNIAYLGWHVPLAFELTFRSETIHNLEHLCFFTTSVMFWWVVIAPWPSRPAWPRWTIIPFLLSADVVNTVLSATLAFSGRVLYPSYADAVRVSALTPLQDQIAAGVEMWVFGSLVFLIPAIFATYKLFSTHSSELSLG